VTAAHDYEHMHRLVDQLTPDQVRQLRRQALRLVGESDQESDDPQSATIPAFAGILDGPSDLSERIDEFVAERFNRPL
jgi:hypothetical protein